MAARPLVRLLEQMDDGLNLLNIILLAIAVGVFLKLRSVLGRRTGHERPPYDPYSGEAGGNDKVVTLPKRPRAEGESGQRTVDAAGDPFAGETDRPIAGLLQDLEERGLLDETLVIWGGEFGRLPVAQKSNKPSHLGSWCLSPKKKQTFPSIKWSSS